METVYVTTSLHASKSICEQGRKWAVAIHAFFIERGEQSIEQLLTAYHIEAILVFTVQGPEIRTFLGRHAFHLSMAELRIQHIRQGMPDHFLEALGAEGPVRLLDCTCGFGSDTIVASFGLPAGSDVHALEISPYMAAVTSWGLAHFVHKQADVTEAMRRIRLQHDDYRDYLQRTDIAPYDIIYFDPMFSRPIQSSPQFHPVRNLLEHEAMSDECLALALTKARRRVVIKGRSFRRLKMVYPRVKLYGGKYSRIGYAVLECEHG